MSSGWIKLHRQIKDNSVVWCEEPYSRAQAWIDLILRANYEDKQVLFNGNLITVKRGSFITSVRKLSADWMWSNDKTLSFLRALESENMIQKQSDNHRTLLIVVNYGFYQDVPNAERTPSERRANASNRCKLWVLPRCAERRANAEPSQLNNNINNNNINNNNNNNKNKNKENKESNIPPLPPTSEQREKEFVASSIISERGFASEVEEIVRDWVQYKIEKRQGYKKTGLQSLLTTVQRHIDSFGEETVIEVIRASMSSNYQGIVWDWCERYSHDDTQKAKDFI